MKANTICRYYLYKQVHDKQALKNHINRARLTTCEVGTFSRETSQNMPIPLFEEPLEFIAHGHIFKRLQYMYMHTLHM